MGSQLGIDPGTQSVSIILLYFCQRPPATAYHYWYLASASASEPWEAGEIFTEIPLATPLHLLADSLWHS